MASVASGRDMFHSMASRRFQYLRACRYEVADIVVSDGGVAYEATLSRQVYL